MSDYCSWMYSTWGTTYKYLAALIFTLHPDMYSIDVSAYQLLKHQRGS